MCSITLGIGQQCVLEQEDEQDQLRGSQSCREPHRLIFSPFASSFFSLSLAQSLSWVSYSAWFGRSGKELSRLDGAGLVSAPGEAQPELLVCWESLSLHPTPRAGCKWVSSPPCDVLGGTGREGKRLHISIASGLFA